MKDYIFYPVLKSDLFVAIGDAARKKLGKKRGKKVPTYLGMAFFGLQLVCGTEVHGNTLSAQDFCTAFILFSARC